MTRYELLRHEMLLRVRDFGIAHRGRFPTESAVDEAFRTVAAAIQQIEATVSAMRPGAGESPAARSAARDALWDRLMALAPSARLIAKTAPGFVVVLRFRHQPADGVMLTAARAFIGEARTAFDRFVALGWPTTFLDDLQALVDGFERTLRHERSRVARQTAARASLKAALAQGLDAVLTLDVIVANALKEDPALLNGWKRARRMNRHGTRARSV
jgi:hypothetical protein